ncbi:MAG: prepilin-type N-terminal cleavage/methylation domain-containing protein [Candidatus Paceibacterota bacterium]
MKHETPRKKVKFYQAVSSFKFQASGSRSRGFSFIETMVIISIIIILSAFAYGAFVTLNRDQALEKDTNSVILLLNQARAMTLGSKGASQYGVHFEADSVTLFKGSTYSASDASNVVTAIGSPVGISAVSLTGGGSEVLFDWLTGDTLQNGTVTLSLNTDPSDSKTITIHQTGLTE